MCKVRNEGRKRKEGRKEGVGKGEKGWRRGIKRY